MQILHAALDFIDELSQYLFLTGEKAIKKKQICVKLVPRNTTEYAVTDLILLSRSKRAPPEYILTGSQFIVICF